MFTLFVGHGHINVFFGNIWHSDVKSFSIPVAESTETAAEVCISTKKLYIIFVRINTWKIIRSLEKTNSN